MLRRLVVIIALSVIAPFVQAQPLASRLAPDALVYVGWQGSQAMPPAFANSHFKGFLDSSRFPQVFSEFYPALIQRVAQDDRQAAAVMTRLGAVAGPLFRHPTAIVIGQPDINAIGAGHGDMLLSRFALVCQAGDEADALTQQFGDLAALAPPGIGPVRSSKEGDLVILSIGYADAAAVLAADPAKSLGASERFKQALAQVARDPVFVFYADPQPLLAMLQKALADQPQGQNPNWARVLEQSGLAGLKGIILTGSFDGANWSTQAFVAAPAPRTGILKMFEAPPLSDAILKPIPQGATWASASHLDLAALTTAVRNILPMFDPNAQQVFDQGLGAAQLALGFNPQTDLFEALGSEWAAYTDPTVGGNGWLGFVVVNHLRKPDVAERSLKKLWMGLDNLVNSQLPKEEKIRIGFEQTRVGDLDIYYVAVPLVSPAWAIRGDTLYFGLYPQVVASADAAARGPSILQNPDFVALRQRLGGAAATDISFSDLPRSVADGYQTALMILQLVSGFADMAGAKTPAMILPPLHLLKKEMTPAGDVAWMDDAGFHYRGQSPFPGAETLASQSNFMLAYSGMMTSIMLPALNASKERANRVKCASNLRQIGQGCLLYANDHQGKYPPDLGTLVEEDLSPEVFVCPSGSNDVPAEVRGDAKKGAAWVREHADYVYLGAGRKDGGNPDTIIAYEKPDAHDGQGMNMLFNDGHVDWFSMPAALQLIEKQKEQDAPRNGKL